MTSRNKNHQSYRHNTHERISLTVRIPQRILAEIDHRVASNNVPISRNHWIVDAIMQQITKAESGE